MRGGATGLAPSWHLTEDWHSCSRTAQHRAAELNAIQQLHAMNSCLSRNTVLESSVEASCLAMLDGAGVAAYR